MATLEKIRSKSVLLVVIIAVALLAFILGDAITNGRNLFGNNTTVAKVGKDKIEIQEYQRKHQELSQQLEEAKRQNPEQFAGYDYQMLSQEALESLIQEKLKGEAVAALDIKSSPELLKFFMLENPQTIIPEMQQLITAMRQSGLPISTPSEAHQLIFQPQTFGLSARQVAPYQQAWIALESRYGDLISQMIYETVLQSTVKANKLDIAATKRDYTAVAKAKVAKKPYGELTDKVSDAEIQKAYEAQKKKYEVKETTKDISFIAVNVGPSQKDMDQASLLAATVVKELRGGGVSKETRKNGLDIQRHDMRLADVTDLTLKAFLQNAPLGSDSIIQNNQKGFKIAKVNSRTTSVDSLELTSIQVKGGKELIASVLAYANSGLPLDSINGKFSSDSVVYQAPQWIALYGPQGAAPKGLGLEEAVYDSLYNSNGSYMVINETEGMAVLATVNKKSSPKEIVEFETIDYVLQPSETTLAEARQKLQKFINTNNTAEKFVKNAQAAGYNPADLAVTPSTPAIPRGYGGSFYPDSRSLVRWIVMDGKDGEVSKIYQSKDAVNPSLYVAAVLDTYSDYVPWTNKMVKEELTNQVRREKAGDAMAKKYTKATLDETARAMNVEPVEVEKIQSGRPAGIVTDSKVIGRILGSKPSGKMQVVKGNDGVYAFIVSEVVEEPVQMSDDDFANMFVNSHRVDSNRALRGNKKVENNIYKFEQGE